MSPIPLIPGQPSRGEDRRLHPRRKLERLAYVDFGPDNGGVLIELGQGGLSFQGVGPVGEAELIHLKFTLPSMSTCIEATGQVVWSNNSGKGGGLRFVDLAEDAQQQINEWISSETPFGDSKKPFATRPGTPTAPRDLNTKQRKSLSLPKEIADDQSPAVPSDGGTRQAKQEASLAPDDGSAAADLNPSVTWPVRRPWNQNSGSRWYSPDPLPDSSVAPGTTTAAGDARPSIKDGDTVAQDFEETPPHILSLLRRQLEQQNAFKEMRDRRRRVVTIAILAVVACLLALVALMGRRVIGLQFDRMVALFRDSNQPTSADGNAFQVEVSERQTPLRKVPSERAGHTSLEQYEQYEQYDQTPAPGTSTAPAETANGRNIIKEVIPPWALQPPLPPLPKSAAASNVTDLPKPLQPEPASVLPADSFQEAVLIERVGLMYPTEAKQQNLTGVVQVSATIGKDGKPRGLKRVSGNPTLAQTALDAISRWRYKPAVLNGEVVEVRTVITINFQIKP